ncbi:efflux RND transporter periplasmic adaptor subunit [Vulcaniibacterium tengchongense]|uniref:Membrane fusion protein (Multidrug efflux system) n=1 Tax=Vulcaniibacterium tengchongense TaxID=1273429 RepID=A0A3N4V4F6_9GAMM|nr:efflux RND transporter periplasmic adaptor subunit [Vulcaniibacterium tengchongense]RPE74599.1 membrane fusion protein (multidrug efflux system) [Vulcaniibacterium tengchongense]
MRPSLGLHAGLALLVALATAACGRNGAAQQRDGAEPPVPVTTRLVRLQPWSDTVLALGNVKARESITVTAKVSETVERVHFDSGDSVATGAPLVTLSGRQQQAALAQAEAAADEAEKLYQRQLELAGQQLIARSTLDTQRAARDVARARVAQMRADIGDRVIRAPFAGVLGIRQVSPGSLVTPGTAIATLDDIARVYVDFPVPEVLLAQLAVGQRVSGTSAAYPGRRFEGTVSTIDARVDQATRAVTVRADFPNGDRALRPGMLVQVTLSRPQRQALVIPEISIVQVGTDSYVFRVKPDGTVERADVKVGGRREGEAEIAEGLKAGDRIVVDGTGKLRPGSRIREATQAEAAAPERG